MSKKRSNKNKVVYVEKATTVTPFPEAVRAYRQFKLIERKCTRHVERACDIWLDAFGGINAHEINQSRVDDYIATNMAEMQPNTIAKYVAMLKAILNDAQSRGLLDSVPRIRPPSFFDERDEHLTRNEVNRLLTWAIKEAEPIEALALATFIYTGVRVNELCMLKGSDFQFDHVVVRKKQGKTRNTRGVPYAETYKDVFKPDKILEAYGENRVFGSIAMTPSAMSEYMGRLLKKGLAAIGVTRSIRVHDLRHTFAFLCGEAGMDIGDLQLLMGHANISMTMRYRGFIKSRAYDVMKNI